MRMFLTHFSHQADRSFYMSPLLRTTRPICGDPNFLCISQQAFLLLAVTCQRGGQKQPMLLQEAGGEAARLQGQPGQDGTGGQQQGQGLGYAVAQRVHAEVQFLQTLRREEA